MRSALWLECTLKHFSFKLFRTLSAARDEAVGIDYLRAAVRKYRLGVCKMKKSKIPKLCQNIGLGKLFLEK